MSSERGAMAVVMAGIIALLSVVVVATASLGVAYSARVQANIAADAGALAAAVATYPGVGRQSPAKEAQAVVARNGARLVSCACRVDPALSVRVVLVVAAVVVNVPVFGDLEIRGVSRAEFDPGRWLGR
jgi:Flp pilus assembly protein TadG